MTAGYKNGTITQTVITTFWVFFFWTLFPPHLFFFFWCPRLWHPKRCTLRCLSAGRVCHHTRFFSPDFPPSRLNTTLPSSEQCLTRRAGECVWPALRKWCQLCSKRLQPGEEKNKLKSGEQSERERSRENGDGRLRGKLHRIWRFYRETRTKKGVMQHVCCLYGGSLNRLIAPSFSRLGCSNVSDHPNSSSVKHICISYIHSIDHWSGRKPLLQFHFYPKCFTSWKISDLRA